jgi:hypothetical protein
MYAQTHLCNRKDQKTYYGQMRVPRDIQPRSQAPRAAMGVEGATGVRGDPAQAGGSTSLVLDSSEQSIQVICSRWQYEVLPVDEAYRLGRPVEEDLQEFRQNRTAVQPLLQEALATGRVEKMEPVLQLFLQLPNIYVECSEGDYQRFLHTAHFDHVVSTRGFLP